LEFTEGADQVRCMRLSPKGNHRWYAECCRTPLGNTIPWIPYVGVVRSAFESPSADDASTFGKVLVSNVGSAVGGPPPGVGLTFRGVAHVTRLLASWAMRGLGHPTPLFDREN